MKVFKQKLADGRVITYEDTKRYFWMLSVLYPLQPFAGIGLHHLTSNQIWLLLPLFLAYVINPLFDHLIGKDNNNPPIEIIPQLEKDNFYRLLTFLVAPFHIIALLVTAWWASSQNLEWWSFIGLAIVAGLNSGLAINTGHELGHKTSFTERVFSQIALAAPVFGHFPIDHNRGHHSYVATPDDCSSARMGENIYKFAFRDIPGSYKRAWAIENKRLKDQNILKKIQHHRAIHALLIGLILQISIVLYFGLQMLLFLIIHNLFAWWQLTSANYIEHYGLLRKLKDNGRFEPCKPHHSWNSNHTFSNLVLFHLERHSDHHVHPKKQYQCLRHDPNQPALPTGYFGCFLLAYLPWLWFKVMDKRLLNLPHIAGDLSNTNIDPSKYNELRRRYKNQY